MGSTPRSPPGVRQTRPSARCDEPGLARHIQGRRCLKLAFDHTLDGPIGAKQGLVDGELLLRLAGERGYAADRTSFPARPPNRAWLALRWSRSAAATTVPRLE